jgi:hypothetical protein
MEQDRIDMVCSIHDRMRINTKFYSESLKGRDLSTELNVDGKIILKYILKNKI